MNTNDVPRCYNITEVEIRYHNPVPFRDRVKVTQSETASQILRQAWDENRLDLVEEFKILLLDRANHCLGVSTVSTGGIHGCIVDPRIIFATALKAHASGIILAHNHPSGNTLPSDPDVTLTQRLVRAGTLLDIPVLDHLILTSERYYSFADEGRMPGLG